MELTAAQVHIIESVGDIRINAIAGSGKTSTLIEYARTRPAGSRILYLAFNRSVKEEARKKFAQMGLSQVRVETAHSLAYRHIVPTHGYRLRPTSYKTHETASILGLKNNGEKLQEYILANHINRFVSYFCHSNKEKIKELRYTDSLSDPNTRQFAARFYTQIETGARLFLAKMDQGELEITHDFYLKKFQLEKPALDFDYILFDEGQDASAAMLDIFMRQTCTKVIVGDTYQQIYAWRFAVNSLEQADFPAFNLSTSFRFRSDIAALATQILRWKKYIDPLPPVKITGIGTSDSVQVKAIIARSNLGLLLHAIEYISQEKNAAAGLYFEGDFKSYTYVEEGASLYDVLYLYNRRHQKIKDELIKHMRDLRELEGYVEKTGDLQLGMMVEVVKKYGNELPALIREIRRRHLGEDEREKAGMIFSTVHRCKGMEYDVVQLAEDFITEEKLARLEKEQLSPEEKTRIHEEINLLYVAVTRTRNRLYIPAALLPEEFSPTPSIQVMYKESNVEVTLVPVEKAVAQITASLKNTTLTFDERRTQHPSAYAPWTTEMDDRLTVLYCEGTPIAEMVRELSRSRGAIRSRIKKLELKESYG